MSPNASALETAAHDFLSHHYGSGDYQVLALAGDASSRRYFRIIHNDEPYVLMAWNPFEDNGRFPFLNVRDHLEKHKVRVPKVLAKSPGQGLILLEDLGDLTLERKFWENQKQQIAMPFYKLAIDELLKIHYPATKDTASNCVALTVDFNVEKLLWEMNYGLEHLIERLCKVKLSHQDRTQLVGEFEKICTVLHNQPKHICHRDFHSRNVMLKLGKAVLIDFQDARTGPVQYDLVSLLHDSYVDLNSISRQLLLDYYIDGAASFGATYNRSEFDQVFEVQKLQRCFKACGSFASFFNTREDTRYLKYLHRTLSIVANTLEQFPEYSLFKAVIRDNHLLDKNYNRPETISA